MPILTWFLIITTWNGGVVAIPQTTREECLENARYFHDGAPPMTHTYCIPGTLGKP